MAALSGKELPPVVLVCGEDEYSVGKRAKEIFAHWSAELGGSDHEVIDAAASRASEALAALRKLNESLNTLPFFGSAKVVWFQSCTFFGTDRTSESQAVAEGVTSLAQALKSQDWRGVRLLLSAEKVDKRKSLYKTVDKLGAIEAYDGWSVDDRDWADQAEIWVGKALQQRGKSAAPDAIAELVTRIGPNPRQLDAEVEKLSLFVGQRAQIALQDVHDICSRNKTARAFALAEALGDCDLRRLLRCLDEELWEVKLDPQRSAIGLLYGLISKVRTMLLLKELEREGWIKPEADYDRFKRQLQRLPAERLPTDKRFNPTSMHPFMLHKALPQIKRYSTDELIQAMEELLQCNQDMVSSGTEHSLLLQQALVRIAEPAR